MRTIHITIWLNNYVWMWIMAIPVQLNDNDGEYPLSDDLIETINGINQHGLSASQKRKHNRLVASMRSKHQSGVIMTVIEQDGSVRMYTVKEAIFGPTGK